MSDAPARAARLSFEARDETVRVVLGGETIAESAHTVLLHENGHGPVRYFPRPDVLMDRFRRTDHATHCSYKGDAAYCGPSRPAAGWPRTPPGATRTRSRRRPR